MPKMRSHDTHSSHAARSAREHYLREKARRARRTAPEAELLAAARREYQALLEAEAARGKGGRPKKTAAKTRSSAAREQPEDGDTDE